jgi:hypothetical protein
MIGIIASAFIDELDRVQLEKIAVDRLSEPWLNRVADSAAKRMRAAGMHQEYIDTAVFGEGGLRESLGKIQQQAGAPGSATHRAAGERIRQVTHEWNTGVAPRKTIPKSWLGAQVAKIKGDPNPYKSHRVTMQQPRLSSDLGDYVRGKLGLEPKPDYHISSRVESNIDNLVPEDSAKLKKSLARRGQQMAGADAMKDLKKGTGKGIADAARKTLLPALQSMPTPLKIAGGIGAGILGKKVLFGDGNKTTITVG